MALIGSIEHFKGNAEEFETYLERVEHLFKVNAVTGDVKVSLFVTLAGPQVYQTLKNLATPRKPGDLEYEEVVELLSKHYSPPVSEIYERYVFNRCNQRVEQSIAEYIVELRRVASSCNFRQFLDEALRDRFVCGIRSEHIQKKLLAEGELTFTKACQLAQVAEVAEKQVKTLTDTSVSGGQVNSFYRKGNYSKSQTYNKSGSKSGATQAHKGNTSNGKPTKCKKCGRRHDKDHCPAVKWKCYSCNKFGHIKRLCTANQDSTVAAVEEDDPQQSDLVCESVNSDLFSLNNIGSSMVKPYKINLKVNGTLVPFEVDTGACKCVISISKFKEILNVPLSPVRYQLNVISGQSIKAVGECLVSVEHKGKVHELVLTVIESSRDFVPLLGRNWLSVLFPNWQSGFCLNHIDTTTSLIQNFRLKYKNVFDSNLCSPIKQFEVKFNIKEGVIPVVRKAYSMPYALKPRVENKLKQMVEVGILKPVTHCEWASPIVVVPKKDGDVRICSDFRLTVNKALNVDQYPLPTPDDIFASLAGGSIFTVLDLTGAYQQLMVHSEFRKYLTISTHLGLYQFSRLTYGISAAPAIFQSIMDQILSGIPGVNCYLDDILISGSNLQEAKLRVEVVLERLSKFNVKVNLDKCKFFKSEVEYLGHRIDNQGIHPTEEKLRAIKKAPEPENLTQLRAYLGLINYYAKFVPMLSSRLKPLYNLLKKETDFKFDSDCRAAFQLSKELILKNQVLTHYDPAKTIVVSCDASSYGVGGVLSHRVNGVEKPVLFVSGTLSKAEQNYSQLEREALAIIFSIKKFHKYIYGRPFILVSDHQPLRVIFNPNKGISVMSASRIIRWNIILSAYDYQIEFRKGSELIEADMLSRLPLQDPTDVDSSINSFNMTDELPLSFQDIATATAKDPILVRVKENVRSGWPSRENCNDLKPFYIKRNELSVDEGCVMLGSKVVIPLVLRESILGLLHENHIGIVRTKMLARSVCWWPGLQQDIEAMISSCQVCQLSQRNFEKYLVSWPKTENIFERVHVDFFYLNGLSYLLLVDSKSRWLDVHCMSKGTGVTQTIEKLKLTFSVMGLPVTIVSDNGPPFNSGDFIKFCNINGINVLKSPPYHPQSNGSAERQVQTIKAALKKYMLQKSSLTVEQQIVNFLFYHRNTPCTITGLSPNDMIFKCKPRTIIDLLKPKKGGNLIFSKNVEPYVKPVSFIEGERVLVGKLGPMISEKWQLGTIVKPVSAVTYLVRVDGRIIYKHVNNLRKYVVNETVVPKMIYIDTQVSAEPKSPNIQCPPLVSTGSVPSDNVVISEKDSDIPSDVPVPSHIPAQSPEVVLRRSSRVPKPPQRLNL